MRILELFGFKKAELSEYRCWDTGVYPYDCSIVCGACVTEHAVIGCNVAEHAPFIVVGHDAGLHVNSELQRGRGPISHRREVELGKFLLDNRSAILQLRELYAHVYSRAAREESPAKQERSEK